MVVVAAAATPPPAAADPVRIVVNFTVVASPDDPDFAGDIATGFFSVVTQQEPGTEVLNPGGFGAEAISFTWAGTTWDTSNSDVYLISREPTGRVWSWAAGGSPSGFAGITASISPDFRFFFCHTEDFECSRATFEYSTARSTELGVFTGFVPNFSIQRFPLEQAPVPEPLTLVLVGSGLCAIAARQRVGRRK